MLRITLEMVPFGVENAKRTIGTMEIANVGGTDKFGQYSVSMESDHVSGVQRIERFDRRRGAWALVSTALRKFGK